MHLRSVTRGSAAVAAILDISIDATAVQGSVARATMVISARTVLMRPRIGFTYREMWLSRNDINQ